jgi:hypothetical protein
MSIAELQAKKARKLMEFKFEPGSYLDTIDKADKAGLRLKPYQYRQLFGYRFQLVMDYCGISQRKIAKEAPGVRRLLIAERVIDETTDVGGISGQNAISECISGERTPGRWQLIVWMMVIKYYWSMPSTQQEVSMATGNVLPKWEDMREIEDNLYMLCGYIMPEDQYYAYEWAQKEYEKQPNVRFRKRHELRFSRISGPLEDYGDDDEIDEQLSPEGPTTDRFEKPRRPQPPAQHSPQTDPNNVIPWRQREIQN